MRLHHKVIATAVMLACMAPAQAQIYKARLTGANENPAVTTAGTGLGVITFNNATHEMRVKAIFSGLTGNTTASHIHCCTTTPTANAGVATQTPTFTGFPLGVKDGSYDNTFDMTLATSYNAAFINANGGTPASAEAALLSGVIGNRSYLNIHSSFAAGGEIRGNLVPFTFFSGASAQTAPITIALDSLGAGTGELNDKLVALAWLEGAAQTNAVAQLSPLPLAMLSSLASDGLFSNYDSIGNRLGGLRADGTAGSGNVWVRYASGEAEQSLRGRGASVDSDGDDLSIGIDYRVSEALLVGAAFGVQRDDVDYNGTLNGSSAELQNNRATLYGELALGGNGFLDAMLTMGSTEQETIRNAGISGIAMSDADHDQWGARVAVGTRIALGSSMTLTPQARFDWAYLDMESYRETGAGPLSLLVNDNDIERERGSLAAQIDWNISTTTIPYLRASWGHEFGDDDIGTIASFNGASAQFTTVEEVMDEDGFTAGFGLNVRNTGSLEGSFGYDYSENGDYDSDLLHARLLMRF